MRIVSFSRILVVSLLVVGGCSSSNSTPNGALTTPVRGTVTCKGKPLTKGTVTFEPEGPGKEASGEIQNDGTFVMSTYKKDDGAVRGKHRVAVDFTDKSVPAKYRTFASSKVEVEIIEAKAEYPIELP